MEFRILSGLSPSSALYERAAGPMVSAEKALQVLHKGSLVLGVTQAGGTWVMRLDDNGKEVATDFRKLMQAPDEVWQKLNPHIKKWSDAQKRAFLSLRGARSVPSIG